MQGDYADYISVQPIWHGAGVAKALVCGAAKQVPSAAKKHTRQRTEKTHTTEKACTSFAARRQSEGEDVPRRSRVQPTRQGPLYPSRICCRPEDVPILHRLAWWLQHERRYQRHSREDPSSRRSQCAVRGAACPPRADDARRARTSSAVKRDVMIEKSLRPQHRSLSNLPPPNDFSLGRNVVVGLVNPPAPVGALGAFLLQASRASCGGAGRPARRPLRVRRCWVPALARCPLCDCVYRTGILDQSTI